MWVLCCLEASHLFGPCEKQSHAIVVVCIHWIYWDWRDPLIQRTLSNKPIMGSTMCSVVITHWSSLFSLKCSPLWTNEINWLTAWSSYSEAHCRVFPIFTVFNQFFSLLNRSLLNVNELSKMPRDLRKNFLWNELRGSKDSVGNKEKRPDYQKRKKK